MKLGRYEVVRELGKGAMGVVYLAKDPLIGRLVALKTIRVAAHADDDETKEFQQRFVREAQAAGNLNHPSIVTVHDIGQDEESGVSFIAMEYVEGYNLKEVLSQGRPLTFEQIGDVVAQIAEGLDFAHAKGIVHRDVKPANIILLDGNRAKITDFGIAKIASGVSNLTSTGQFLGTPNYMAPEQIKGGAVDGRTDIFSLGICFYECLTRRKPFGGDSLTSISYKIVHESFPSLQDVNPQIPGGYEEIIATCLAKDPAKRYQRGKDLANAIRAVNRGERPARPQEPAIEDATVVTRDREKIPTVEIPFPEASLAADPFGTATTAASAAAMAANAAIPMPVAQPAPSPSSAKAAPRKPAGPNAFRKTLDGVRAYPLWRTPIHPVIIFAIAGAAVAVLLAIVITIRSKAAEVPKVDTFMEARVKKERQLRLQADRLVQAGRTSDAYNVYAELNKLDPSSDYVNGRMQWLAQIRAQDDINRQQRDQAKQVFEQAMTVFNNKQYEQAIVLLQQSYKLDPTSQATARYLQLAQQEDEKQRQARLTAMKPKAPTKQQPVAAGQPVPSHGTAGAPQQQPQQSPQNAAPAVITVAFDSPFSDGTITVRVGTEVVAQQQLWREQRVFHRHVPQAVLVSKGITPKNADVEVWIVVPSAGINEHRAMRGNFAPGSSHRLTITADVGAKQFSYQLN